MVMPGLVGGFFRHGQFVNVLLLTPICTDHLFNYRNGSKLNTVLSSNEVKVQGSAKWETDKGRTLHSITLLCLAINIRLAQANLHFKNGSPTLNQLLIFVDGLKFLLNGKLISETVSILISPKGYTVTGDDVNIYPSYTQLGSSQTKRGNLGKVFLSNKKEGIPQVSVYERESLTYTVSKHMSELYSLNGGKIAEKANAHGNAWDTRKSLLTFRVSGLMAKIRLQNSVCLNKVPFNQFVRHYSIRDLSKLDSRSEKAQIAYNRITPKDKEIIREEVRTKQIELVKLAQQRGLYDKKVLDLQIILIRSKAFREWAILLLKDKAGSQTPGFDREIFDKENPETFTDLVAYLREIAYHPNRYHPLPIKIVWIPKPGKTEKRPLGIPTLKDRGMQTLINLVLYPLVELTSDTENYGFREYRDCKMAIAAVRAQLQSTDLEVSRTAIKKNSKFKHSNAGAYLKANEEKWLLDADIKGFFDNINHK
jgi:Reverse transcriptase (RNA-dependent DNA polymerase)